MRIHERGASTISLYYPKGFAHFVSFTPREEGKKQRVMGRVERRVCIKVDINYCLISSAINLVRIILVKAVTYI